MEEKGVEDDVVKRLDCERDLNQKNRQRFGGVGGVLSIEQFFEDQEVPSWRKQLTFRAFFVSFWLSILFSVIVMKLNLTTGIIPSLNVSAGLLGFFFVKSWTKFLERSGFLRQPFTRQENTVIQTCVVASSGIAFSGLSLIHFHSLVVDYCSHLMWTGKQSSISSFHYRSFFISFYAFLAQILAYFYGQISSNERSDNCDCCLTCLG